jgi:hypothetical protein
MGRQEQALRRKAYEFFGSWDEALRRIGLDPAKIRLFAPRQHLTAEQTIELLKRRRDQGLPLNSGAIQKSDTPLERAIRKYFRFHHCALRAAGIDPMGIVQKWPKRGATESMQPYRTRASVIMALRERRLENKPLRAQDVFEDDPALAAAVWKYFGSFAKAYRHFQIHPPRESKWHRADKAAIIADIRRRKATGQSLSCKRIRRAPSGTGFINRAKILFGRWSNAVTAAGFEPYEGAQSPWPYTERSEIVAEIRRRKRAGKSLGARRVNEEKWGQAFVGRAKQLFGSWSAALQAAGFQPSKYARTQWADARQETILAEIQRRHAAGESLALKRVRKGQGGRALQNRCDRLFGSWNNALRAAGVQPARERSPWISAGKAAILAEIRRRKRIGESLVAKKLARTKWGRPLVNRARVLFGSWNAAVTAACENHYGRS